MLWEIVGLLFTSILGVYELMVSIACGTYCYGTLSTNNFLFYFILFFLILLFFFFILFYFPGKMMKQARDKEVTWKVTWCDVIGLEGGRRI